MYFVNKMTAKRRLLSFFDEIKASVVQVGIWELDANHFRIRNAPNKDHLRTQPHQQIPLLIVPYVRDRAGHVLGLVLARTPPQHAPVYPRVLAKTKPKT